MYDLNWYELPLDSRACAGGEEGVNGEDYKGGEFMPFYVPRPVMPQIHYSDYPALAEFATFRGCRVHDGTADPMTLEFHQRVTWPDGKVVPMDQLNKPVLVSNDRYVLDGNHRLMRHRQLKKKIKFIMLDRPFEDAIALLMAFPGTYEATA